MRVHARAGLELQHVVILVQCPDTSKRCIEVTHHRLGAPLQNILQVFLPGEGHADIGANQRPACRRGSHLLCLLLLADVPDEAGEDVVAGPFNLSERDFDGELLAALPSADEFNSVPVEVPLTSLQIASEARFVSLAHELRHQNRQRLSNQFR